MTLEEAITDLECLEQSETALLADDEKVAIKLGIEALKHILYTRGDTSLMSTIKLPGETEE